MISSGNGFCGNGRPRLLVAVVSAAALPKQSWALLRLPLLWCLALLLSLVCLLLLA